MSRFLIALSLFASGCGGFSGADCGSSERFFSGGITEAGDNAIVWQSSPSDGPFLPFEGGTRFHFRHELGLKVTDVDVEIAFTERPFAPGGGGATDAAGNQAVRLVVNEDEVVVENQTCANQYVRVVVTAHR